MIGKFRKKFEKKRGQGELMWVMWETKVGSEGEGGRREGTGERRREAEVIESDFDWPRLIIHQGAAQFTPVWFACGGLTRSLHHSPLTLLCEIIHRLSVNVKIQSPSWSACLGTTTITTSPSPS